MQSGMVFTVLPTSAYLVKSGTKLPDLATALEARCLLTKLVFLLKLCVPTVESGIAISTPAPAHPTLSPLPLLAILFQFAASEKFTIPSIINANAPSG